MLIHPVTKELGGHRQIEDARLPTQQFERREPSLVFLISDLDAHPLARTFPLLFVFDRKQSSWGMVIVRHGSVLRVKHSRPNDDDAPRGVRRFAISGSDDVDALEGSVAPTGARQSVSGSSRAVEFATPGPSAHRTGCACALSTKPGVLPPLTLSPAP